MSFQPKNQFTEAEQEQINTICTEENLSVTAFEYFLDADNNRKQNMGNQDICRPMEKIFILETVSISQKYNYIHPIDHESHGINSLTFKFN